MSDRMDEVLSSIDATIAGADEDWDVSGDAMRWAPQGAPPVESELDHAVKQMIRFGEIWSGAAQSYVDGVAAAFGPVMGLGSNSDSVPARLSEGEAMVPGPDGPVHLVGDEVQEFRRFYLDQPVQTNRTRPNDDRSTT